MNTRPIQQAKKSGQVLLETAIVFASLAVIAIGSVNLFSRLNSNMGTRINQYRQDRINAINGAGHFQPAEFLYNDPSPGSADPISPVNFFEDRRVRQAQEKLDYSNLILYTVIPYKLNQLRSVIPHTGWGWQHDELSKTRAWAKCDYIKNTLIPEMRGMADVAWQCYPEAIALLHDALDHPTPNGPLDNSPGQDPDRLEFVQSNRDQLAEYIRNLEEQIQPPPPEDGTPVPDPFSFMSSIRNYVDTIKRCLNHISGCIVVTYTPGTGGGCPPGKWCMPGTPDIYSWYIGWGVNKIPVITVTNPKNGKKKTLYATLEEFVGYLGKLDPTMLTNAGLVRRIEGLYVLVNGRLNNLVNVGRARSRAIEVRDHSQIKNGPSLVFNGHRRAGPLLYQAASQLVRCLERLEQYWNAATDPTDPAHPGAEILKDYYKEISRQQGWALYEVTDVNRAMATWPAQ